MRSMNLLDQIRQAAAGRAGGQAQRRTPARPVPPALIGGESPQSEKVDGGAKVDWFTCTWKPEADEHVGAAVHQWLTYAMGGVMGESVSGMFGYAHGVRFYVPVGGNAVHVARVDWGGDHHGGRARLDISGAGCGRVLNWYEFQSEVEQLAAVTLTRVDLAVDCLKGEFSVVDAADWWDAGDFNAGGRRPSHSLIGDWFDVDAPRGRTLNVGQRQNGKMLRCYEKGKQLGDSTSPWTRFEVEIRNTDRDIPFDVLTNCDTYFVGAYKCLERLLDVAGTRIATHQKEGEISVEHLTEYARMAYGQLVHVLRGQLSAGDVLDSISRPGIPKRLERASLGGFLNGSPPDLHH